MSEHFEDLKRVSDTAVVAEDGNTNGNKNLTRDELIKRLNTGEPLDFQGLQISDGINLNGVTFRKPIKVQNLVCTGEANFNGARFQRGVDLSGCRFQKLNLADARVEGALILDLVVLGAETEYKLRKKNQRSNTETQSDPPPVVADFTNLRVAGCLSMMGARVYGSLFCTQADIEDDFRIDEAQIHGDLRLRRAHFGEFCTDGKQRTVIGAAISKELEKPRRPTRIYGRLDLTSARLAGDVRLITTFIGGELGLQAADINGNFLCRARKHVCTWLDGGAWLLGVRIAGSVDFNGCHVRGNLQLDGAKVQNNFSLDGAVVEGNFLLQNASIGNTLFLRTTRVQPTLSSPEKNLRCRIDGTAWLLGATVMGDIDISGVRISKGLMMQNVDIGQNLMAVISDGFQTHVEGDVSLHGARVRGAVEFGGAVVGGDLDLEGTSIEGGFMAYFYLNDTDNWRVERARFGGRLHASSATIGKQVLLMGLTVRAMEFSEGDLKDPGALASRLRDASDPLSQYIHGRFTPTTQEKLRQYDGSLSAAESLRKPLVQGINELLKDVSLFDEQRFAHVTLSDKTTTLIRQRPHVDLVHFNRLLLEDAYPLEIAKKERGVDFGGAHINGEFSLYSQDVMKDLLHTKRAALQVRGLLGEREQQLLTEGSLAFTEIEGDLQLTRTRVLGDVTLNGMIINGKLDMRDAHMRANINCRPIEIDNRDPVRASVLYADFETLDMIGDMNLTGLDIKGRREDSSDGDLILRDARIRGRLELCPPNQAQNNKQITSIGGALRLNAAEISHAVLTGSNLFDADKREDIPKFWQELQKAWHGREAIMYLLRGGPKEKEIPAHVELERAIIGRLQIFEPFPGTLDLSNLKVDSWDWPKERSQYFNDMLTRSHPFKKSNYLAIEKALRNRGEDEQADEVHVLMRRRDRRQTKGLWRVLLDIFLNHTIKYGTTSKRLAWFMVIWFVLSVLIFSDPKRVEYDFSPEVDLLIATRHPDVWTTMDAAFLATRLHVPIVSLGVEDKIEPSGAWLKAYGIIVVGASWVMWPLLIASASGLIRKRE